MSLVGAPVECDPETFPDTQWLSLGSVYWQSDPPVLSGKGQRGLWRMT